MGIAPELLSFDRSSKDIDTKTDIFSLGIILLELLCDIKAPSQGKVFQDLRSDIIDFMVIEPSPIAKSKCTKQSGFGFKQNEKIIDFEAMHQIDTEIKDLCRHMLRKQSEVRPNCAEIIDQIHEIVNNERYSQYFAQCDTLKELSLAPENL